MSTTNLDPAVWQPVPLAPFPSNDAIIVRMPVTELRRFFRLQPISLGLGVCVFQATPPVINSGGSSTLTWCPQAGYSYWISPAPGGGAGIVTGNSLNVSPTNTTVYTLTASNALGAVTADTATVICNPCGWLQLTNIDADITFDYSFSRSTLAYDFSVFQFGSFTFHLQRFPGSTDTDAYFFGTTTADPLFGVPLDEGFIKDREVDKTGPQAFTTTEVTGGLAPSLHDVSSLTLHVTCTTVDFSFNVLANVTEATAFGTFAQSDGVGTGQVTTRPIEVIYQSIRGYADISAAYPPNSGDYFVPSSDVGKALFSTGTVTAPNAGTALITWSFFPPP